MISTYSWDPFHDLATTLAGLDRALSTAGATPGVNLYADDDGAEVTTELPGVAAGDVQVQLQDDVLTISATRSAGNGDGEVLAAERPQLRFSRSISLPFAADADQVQARLADGVLHVTVKRAASDRPRRIAVNAN